MFKFAGNVDYQGVAMATASQDVRIRIQREQQLTRRRGNEREHKLLEGLESEERVVNNFLLFSSSFFPPSIQKPLEFNPQYSEASPLYGGGERGGKP